MTWIGKSVVHYAQEEMSKETVVGYFKIPT